MTDPGVSAIFLKFVRVASHENWINATIQIDLIRIRTIPL
jgi:hypothetical protein